MKRICCFILALILTFCTLFYIPLKTDFFKTTVMATGTEIFTFGLMPKGDSYQLSACDPTATGEITIPATYNNLPVTRIYFYAFDECDNITTINLPSTIETIEDTAFISCGILEKLTVDENNPYFSSEDGILFNKDKTEIVSFPRNKNVEKYVVPENVTAIRDNAFYLNQHIKEIAFPEGLKSIGECAFCACSNIKEIKLPDTVTWIGTYAFGEVNLSTVFLSANIEYLGKDAFAGPDLTVFLPETVTGLSEHAIYGVNLTLVYSGNREAAENLINNGQIVYEENLNIYENTSKDTVGEYNNFSYYITKENEVSIYAYTGNEKEVVVPETIEGFPVTSIGLTFANYYEYSEDLDEYISYVERVTLPDTIKRIEPYAFKYCYYLKEMIIPEDCEYIGESAFKSCVSLRLISISKNVKYIGENAFTFMVGTLILPKEVTGMSEWSFYFEGGCNLYYDGGEDSLQQLFADGILPSEYHFLNVTYDLPKDIKKSNGFTYFVMDDEIKIVDYLNNDTVVEIPERIENMPVTDIGFSLGYHADVMTVSPTKNIQEVILPNTLKTIGDFAFAFCLQLKSITIPENITSVGVGAFAWCENLESVIIPDSVNEIGNIAFDEFTGKIYCFENSFAHTYAIENELNYNLVNIMQKNGSEIDYENKLLFTNETVCKSTSDLLTQNNNVSLTDESSYSSGDNKFYGTSSIIKIENDNGITEEYTIIVNGDLNGDSICNVLDAFEAEQISNGHKTATKEQIYAANYAISDEITVSSYQNVVNTALKNQV